MRLRAETTVSVQWIAKRLQRGASGYVQQLLYNQRKAKRQRYDNIKNRPLSIAFPQTGLANPMARSALVSARGGLLKFYCREPA